VHSPSRPALTALRSRAGPAVSPVAPWFGGLTAPTSVPSVCSRSRRVWELSVQCGAGRLQERGWAWYQTIRDRSSNVPSGFTPSNRGRCWSPGTGIGLRHRAGIRRVFPGGYAGRGGEVGQSEAPVPPVAHHPNRASRGLPHGRHAAVKGFVDATTASASLSVRPLSAERLRSLARAAARNVMSRTTAMLARSSVTLCSLATVSGVLCLHPGRRRICRSHCSARSRSNYLAPCGCSSIFPTRHIERKHRM